MTPYYDEDGITIYCGDCLELSPLNADVMVTDPPYGIDYHSGRENALPSVAGDADTAMRDTILSKWWVRPLAVFASWRCRPPIEPRGQLIWSKNCGGMGDLSFPWKPDYEVCWIYGDGWAGHRGSSILRARTVPTWNSGPARRVHPTEKPIDLLEQIIEKAPAGVIADPFMGSGTTLVAAKNLGRRAIGIEIEERYCEIAAKRLSQKVLNFSNG